MRRTIVRALILALLPLGVACAVAPADRDASAPVGGGASPSRRPAHVTEVIDGDTIRVSTGGDEFTVRLIGIDTPERDGPYTDRECFGDEATALTEAMLDGRDVELEYDVDRHDRYDRTLAYVWLGTELVNESILAQGAGVLLTIPPNVAYVDRFEAAEREAMQGGRGLWGACS